MPSEGLVQERLSLAHLLGPDHAPLQREMVLAAEFEVCAVAGMGGGKTWAAVVAAFRHAIRFPEAKVLIARLTFPELVETTKFKFYQMVKDKQLEDFFVKPVNFDYTERTNYAKLKPPYHSEFFFTNLDKDLNRHKNKEYSFVFIDQLEEVDFEVYQLLLQRTRWPKVLGPGRQILSAANDEGDNWIRRRFLTHEPPHGVPEKNAPRRLIRGTSLQNPYIDTNARTQLLLLPPELQERWVFATMAVGRSRLLPDFQVVDPVDIPGHWPRWLGVDPARSSGVTCGLVLTANPDSTALGPIQPNAPHFMAEYWSEGTEAETHAEALLRITGHVVPRARVMDQSAWHSAVNSRRLGRVTVADLYIRAGLPVVPSSGDEWTRVMLYLSAARRGLTISSSCTNLIRQAPEYRIKGQRGAFGPIKINRAQTFHAVDAGGYALSVLPSRVTATLPTQISQPAFVIADGIDAGSRRHWEPWLAGLPRARGRESVITQGFDEDEFHQDEVAVRAPGGLESEDSW